MRLLIATFVLIIFVVIVESDIVLFRNNFFSNHIRFRSSTDKPTWHTIKQRVDHFNPRDLRTWNMRYISDDEFFESGGPIIIYLGGEWEIAPWVLKTNQIRDLAKANKGYMFYTEHRYYGKSYPTTNLSVDNLQYLSMDQSLADVAYFIQHIKSTINGLENSKVVAVGCSYSATMATWIRLKYPHLVSAAYASSAPVKAVADFNEYFEIVGNNIAAVSQSCWDLIANATSELEENLETEEGIDEVSKKLETCKRIQNVEPYKSFLFFIISYGGFGTIIQSSNTAAVQQICYTLGNLPGTPLDKLIGYMRSGYGKKCFGDYDEFMEKLRSEELSTSFYRLWFYQACTEFGFFFTTTSEYQPFGNNVFVENFVNGCKDLFGEEFGNDILENGIKRTNTFYGSTLPEITKVVSVHGAMDPWHPLGILNDLNPLAPAILINGSFHCDDLFGYSYTKEMQDAKSRVKKLIGEWLQD